MDLSNCNIGLDNSEEYSIINTIILDINMPNTEYENIIISCTNLPTLSIINELESLFNNNVISSNSCLFNKIKKEVVG